MSATVISKEADVLLFLKYFEAMKNQKYKLFISFVKYCVTTTVVRGGKCPITAAARPPARASQHAITYSD